MKLKYILRRPIEYALVLLGQCTLPFLPRSWLVALAHACGKLPAPLYGALYRVGKTNLDLAFGDTRSDAEKERILRRSMTVFVLTMLDIFWFSRFTERRLRRWVDAEEIVDALRDKPDVRVNVTGHFGNWEILGQMVSLRGIPLLSVAAPIANPAVDRLYNRNRRRTGQRIIPREGALKRVIRHLKSNGCVALLLDQNTKPSEGGVFVRYFNRLVPVSEAAASLALHTRSNVLIGLCVVDAAGRYRGFVYRILPVTDYQHLPLAQAARRLTQTITSALEEAVREYPEFWLWLYKRWKYIPPNADPADYPFYAKPLRPVDRRKLEKRKQRESGESSVISHQ